jgi:hypothetical protein
MILDLRIPMGLMFSLLGAILAAYGLSTMDSPIYKASLGIDVNLYWGLVLLAFGTTMYVLGRRGQERLAKLPPEPVDETRPRTGH